MTLACQVERIEAENAAHMLRVSALLQLLEEHMTRHGLRIRDLFSMMDKDRSQGTHCPDTYYELL